jgi:hypothetical protein
LVILFSKQNNHQGRFLKYSFSQSLFEYLKKSFF